MYESMQSTLHSKLFWVSAIFVLFYLYVKKVLYTYWTKHGVPQEDALVPSGIFGTDFLTKKITIGNVFKKSYFKFKNHPYHGLYIFHKPVLMVNDPELIKQILVKEFTKFADRGLYSNPQVDPLSGNLFLLSGDKWRNTRAKLSPTFTSGKLKHMFPILRDIAKNMIKVADENLLKSDILELKDIVARYTTDTIFSLAFGLESNCLKEPNNEFRYYGDLSVVNSIFRTSLAIFAPGVLETLQQPSTNPKLTKFFTSLFRDMVEKRKAENIKRKDFLDSLIELMEQEQIINNEMANSEDGNISGKLDLLEATAQAFVFFVAGFETSSSVATHCLYELAKHPDVQEKVHKEIDELLSNSNGLTYENLLQLEYLDMVFYEAMRKHTSIPVLNRVCLENYKMPGSNLTISKGTSIIISVSGLHNDPDIYPEPEKFDPTRFSKENVAARHPYAYLAFGEGPRICIGKRLGILQSKMALFYMLANYKFSVCDKTPIPNEYSLDSFLQTPRTGIYLKTEKRKAY